MLRLEMEERYGFLPGREHFFDVITKLAYERRYNPLTALLKKCQDKWENSDRTPRLDTWLTVYGGAAGTPYTSAVGRLSLIAAVRRARQPGVKHDEILVLVSEDQGTNKSSTLQALAMDPAYFTDSFPLHAEVKRVIEALKGKWIVECSELAGLKKSAMEEVKALLSRQVDEARMSYDRENTIRPRQCVFFGTTNNIEFLRDRQNRRWWPVKIARLDLDRLNKEEIELLWGEAAFYEAQGEPITLDSKLWSAAKEVQDEHKLKDGFVDILDEVLGELEGRIRPVQVDNILRVQNIQRTPDYKDRVNNAMMELGWKKNPKAYFPNGTKHGTTLAAWVKGDNQEWWYFMYNDKTDRVELFAPEKPIEYEKRLDAEGKVPF